ncbi:hypothetical protein [Paracoccus sp. MKU1]|uniref:hypothetical protein n=1 Tax=Paracoccus sp. MKU1 TaxID=1745182 RepID=UPI0007191E4A|nr:hypothetical protein [Paracoccus sp. MKU1]KRW94342.1 hypothetical protein AQY21_20650 [Paracoccus sp. MKU1]
MNEITVRQRRSPSRPKETNEADTPGRGNASAYDVSRRVGDKSVILGRIVPSPEGKTGHVLLDGKWIDLGSFANSHDAFAKIVAHYDRALGKPGCA